MSPEELLAAWHDQQKAFIELRDLRTRTMIDVLLKVRAEKGTPIKVLDLACGPGSLGTAVMQAIPDSSVVAVDRDPVLLRLGRETNKFDNIQFIDEDITSPNLPDSVGTDFDGVISATALHWLSPDQLAALYLRLGKMMNPGAVFMNGDHLFYDAVTQPYLRKTAEDVRDTFQNKFLEEGALSWDAWWKTALEMPGWQEETKLWHERWADDRPSIKVNVDFHLSALQAAGFVETAQIYQWFDDRIIFGRISA